MKSNTFFEMTNEELNNKVQELKKQLFELRFKQSVSKLSNPLSINECKKDIARALTILRQRQLGISEEPTKTVKKKTSKSKA
ncbi:MAG: 50S ribosomal protein L29 [Firmicutes bacterium ADurb.Bin080]|jgi:large subunit ribosomal protein L29|nr:50S ribosomal protein L29 [Clostridiales bacterium]OQC15599.1 MAG: 50S ribosomal protein L29 [Firmicutes bacterium ADurb.Bin080]